MREPYEEGVASHLGPESCTAGREDGGEALTGARAGWVSSPEITGNVQGADVVPGNGRPHRLGRYRESQSNPAGSETPCMHGNSMCGSRESSRLTLRDSSRARVVNPTGARRR